MSGLTPTRGTAWDWPTADPVRARGPERAVDVRAVVDRASLVVPSDRRIVEANEGPVAPDPHSGPVSDRAWHADALARERGRVEIFNATRPHGLDGWTMDLAQYELMRAHVLDMVDEHAAEDGTVALRDVVAAAQERYGAHPLFPGGRTRNYCTFTKVDLEARCEIERVPGSSPQRIRRPVS